MGVLEPAELEAVLDERIDLAGNRPTLDPEEQAAARARLEAAATGRRIEWAATTVTQGEVLDAFAAHCADELEDVVVESFEPTVLVVRWRRETSRLELRNGFVGVEQLASETPTMLLGDVGPGFEALVELFLDRADMRSRVLACDLDRLERIGAVRSSAFVYFEWFLRDAYGVKLEAAPAFTRGLIDRGIISLGMG